MKHTLKSRLDSAVCMLYIINLLQQLVLLQQLSHLYKMQFITSVDLLGRYGSASLCRVERKNNMAATYNVLAFKR